MVLDSVKRTGRLLVVHQAVKVGGFGGEIVAEATEQLFDRLECAPRRLGAPRTPVPFAEPLETACRVSEKDVVTAALEMTGMRVR
jgi:acetoin:2,6-dichlorophenolindophenol oxidoreductase subunit beta